MIDRESSTRLDVIRFPLMVNIVFIHTYAMTVPVAGASIGINQPDFITDFVRNVIREIVDCTPALFFLMSGYLFFLGFQWAKQAYFDKLKRRVRTLLIPFLFWNIAVLLLNALAQSIPATQRFIPDNTLPIASYTPFDYLNAIIGINRLPIDYQFWFIRDLMVLVILTPLIYFLNKKIPAVFIGIVALCWFLGILPVFFPKAEAVFFFSVGSLVALRNKSIFALDRYLKWLLLGYIPIVIFNAVTTDWQFYPYFNRLAILVGILLMLYFTKYILKVNWLKSSLLWLSASSFFVFAAHEPLLTVIRKLAYTALNPSTSIVVLSLYFAIPLLVIIITVVFHYILRRIAPKFTELITGGRSDRDRDFMPSTAKREV